MVQICVRIITLGQQRQERFTHQPIYIGRDKSACLRLSGWRVGGRHARLYKEGKQLFIEDLGSIQGTLVNNERIKYYGPLQAEDKIVIGPYQLFVQCAEEQDWDTIAPVSESFPPKLTQQHWGHEQCSQNRSPTVHTAYQHYCRHHEAMSALRDEVLKELNLRELVAMNLSQASMQERVLQTAKEILKEQEAVHHKEIEQPELLLDFVLAEICGLGPLELLLADAEVSEIMVNGLDGIFVERKGVCEPVPVFFSTQEQIRNVIERIVAPLGRRVDESMPMVDARLADGSRVHIVLPPIALNGPIITIRKFKSQLHDWQHLVAHGSISEQWAMFLQQCVQNKKNMIISGGTGTGKTTLLNILCQSIPEHERIITIEDAAELQLSHPNLVRLEARSENVEGAGAIPIRELVRNALRMRPDRIIVGECRGAEAFDMLSAMNTGHEGSLTTLHANSPREAIHRLESLVLMAAMGLPFRAIRDYIAMSIDYIVQIERLANGHRRLKEISAVTGCEGEVIQMEPVFSIMEN